MIEDGGALALAAGGGAAGLGGAVWAALRWLFHRVERGDEGIREKLSSDVGAIHRRIDDTRNEYVRRDDYARDMAQLRTDVAGIRDDVRAQGISITARLDQLILSRAMGGAGGGDSRGG